MTIPCWVELLWGRKSYLFCWFCIPTLWSSAHGWLVGALSPVNHRGLHQGCNAHGQRSNSPYRACWGSFKIDWTFVHIWWLQNKDKLLTWSQIILELKFTILWNEFLSIHIIKPTNKRRSQNTRNKRIIKELRNSWIDAKRIGPPQKRRSGWCPFFVMTSVFRSHCKVSSKSALRYWHKLTISTGSPCIWITTWTCPCLLKSTIISLGLPTFRSRCESSHQSMKSSGAALWPSCIPWTRESKALSSAYLNI